MPTNRGSVVLKGAGQTDRLGTLFGLEVKRKINNVEKLPASLSATPHLP